MDALPPETNSNSSTPDFENVSQDEGGDETDPKSSTPDIERDLRRDYISTYFVPDITEL